MGAICLPCMLCMRLVCMICMRVMLVYTICMRVMLVLHFLYARHAPMRAMRLEARGREREGVTRVSAVGNGGVVTEHVIYVRTYVKRYGWLEGTWYKRDITGLWGAGGWRFAAHATVLTYKVCLRPQVSYVSQDCARYYKPGIIHSSMPRLALRTCIPLETCTRCEDSSSLFVFCSNFRLGGFGSAQARVFFHLHTHAYV